MGGRGAVWRSRSGEVQPWDPGGGRGQGAEGTGMGLWGHEIGRMLESPMA
jgi:hypothetical protein